MAMGFGGGGQAGPTLYMSIYARDRTGDTFDRVTKRMDLLSTTTLRTMSRVGNLAMSFATLGKVTGLINDEQARMIGIIGTVISTLTTMAYVVKGLTTIEWAHVAALIWKHSLMTLGIGVAIAAAAAIAVLALTTQQAADSQKNYNQELEKGLTIEKRREASRALVRRGIYTEVIE